MSKINLSLFLLCSILTACVSSNSHLKYRSIKCGQFSKSFKTSQKLTALLFYFSLGKGLISLLVVKKFRYYLDEDTKGVTNVHPK